MSKYDDPIARLDRILERKRLLDKEDLLSDAEGFSSPSLSSEDRNHLELRQKARDREKERRGGSCST